ncbi:hypothetical protein JW859_04500 [bacterium]|nr:hypothetical protein [bacterium]
MSRYMLVISFLCLASLLILGASCVEDSDSGSYSSSTVKGSSAETSAGSEELPTATAPQSASVDESQLVEQKFEPLEYEIVLEKDLSLKALKDKPFSQHSTKELEALPMNVRKQYSISVGEDFKAGQIEPTVKALIDSALAKDADIDEIVVFVYTVPDLVGEAFDVAKAEWAPDGKWGSTTPEIAESNDRGSYKLVLTICEDLEEYLVLRSEKVERFGFSTEERKQIFTELVLAEDRAAKEAEELYPIDPLDPDFSQDNLMKNIDKEDELCKVYTSQVYEQYGIDEDIADQISSEACEKRWPMPDIE